MKIPDNKRLAYIIFTLLGLFLITGLALAASHPLRRVARISFETILANAYMPPNEVFPAI